MASSGQGPIGLTDIQEAYWIGRGAPYFATHPDFVCPTAAPTVLVDCGSVCGALEKATGRTPDAVLGKPRVEIVESLLRRLGLGPERVAMAGDRLYTDMKMALSCGVMAILVLSGETGAPQVQGSAIQPDLVVQNLEQLGRKLAHSR